MEKIFSNQVVIVTGAGSGIGQATAILYAQHGAMVIVSDINEEGGLQTLGLIQQFNGDAIFVKADVGKPEDCKSLVGVTIQRYGRLDIAFNISTAITSR